MSAKKVHIVLLYNDDSQVQHGNRLDDVAVQSTVATTTYIYTALIGLGYPTSQVAVRDSLETLARDLSPHSTADTLIFYNCDGFNGSNQASVEIVRLIENLGFRHTGAPAEAVALCTDKPRAKQRLLERGIPTPRFQVFERPDQEFNLKFPVIIKPSDEDGSIGITIKSVVSTPLQLQRQVRLVLKNYEESALVEEFIPGRELAVAMLGNAPIQVLPIAEDDYTTIADPLKRLLTYESKWDPSCAYYAIPSRIPADLTPAEHRLIASTARRSFRAVGLRDLGRVDIRFLDGIPYVIDINEIPDLAPDAGFWHSAQVAGLTYPRMINKIVTNALHREGFLP